MTDATPPLPPLPPRPAGDAARDAATAPAVAPYDPASDPDDTGVPSVEGQDAGTVGRGFLRALFDLSFRTFITRRLASVFYFVGLMAIAIGFVVYFVQGLATGIAFLVHQQVGAGLSLIVATLVIVPIVTFLAVVLLRFTIEAVVALIAIAENTERTAENTRR